MKRFFLVSLAMFLLAGVSAAGYGEPDLVLWGTMKVDSRGRNPELKSNTVRLDRKASVRVVEGEARAYCVFTGKKALACGGADRSLVGFTLEPGDYSVYPLVERGRRWAEIKLYLEYED